MRALVVMVILLLKRRIKFLVPDLIWTRLMGQDDGGGDINGAKVIIK